MINIEEKHYTLGELAEKWRVSRKYICRWFQGEAGILRLSARHNSKMIIPASVAERVYKRITEAERTTTP